MDIESIKDLIITMDKTSIEKIEIEKNDFKIMISKRAANGGNMTKSVIDAPVMENTGDNNMPAKIIDDDIRSFENEIGKAEYAESLIDDESIFVVKSPIVGTFFKAPGPDNPPFVDIGDMVEKGQTLCIIEAMKMMNEIECEHKGQVVEIFVEDEGIVEFGQPLMMIRR